MDFDTMSPEEIEAIETDDFFRVRTEEEKEALLRERSERKERLRQREEAAGKRPLRAKPEDLDERVKQLEDDRREMVALMDRCDQPAVKARLGDFVLEMDNELARLRDDPLELDDEDRRELRLFHLRKWKLPGAARTRDFLTEDFTSGIRASEGTCREPVRGPLIESEEPWHEIASFALELGDTSTPTVLVDVRLEAVERLPEDALKCHFMPESFDLQIWHQLEGRRYRLRRLRLQHKILPEESHLRVRRNHVVLCLRKAPVAGPQSEGSRSAPHGAPGRESKVQFPTWTDLCVAT